MTYAAITGPAAPMGTYDTFTQRRSSADQGRREGLLVKLARSAHTGSQILEVRTPQELCQRYVQAIIIPPVPSSSAPPRGNWIRCRPSTWRSSPCAAW